MVIALAAPMNLDILIVVLVLLWLTGALIVPVGGNLIHLLLVLILVVDGNLIHLLLVLILVVVVVRLYAHSLMP